MADQPFFDLLPEEVTEQILVKIQCEKSILRCTSVCKSWCCSIISSQFINTHLSISNKTKYLYSETRYCNWHGGIDHVYSLLSDSAPSEECCTLVFPHRPDDVRIHGCCNGVICYSIFDTPLEDIFLWNPTVRKLKTLPQSRDSANFPHAVGFWFDKDKNDYVIAKIVNTIYMSSIEVYSLSSNSWKTISDTCPDVPYPDSDDNLVYAKGKLHWLALHEQGWRIVSLDMNNAKFQVKVISRCCLTERLCLEAVDAVSFYVLGRHDLCCPYDLGLQHDHLPLLGFRNNGEALFPSRHNNQFLEKREIVSYDFRTRQMKYFGFFNFTLIWAHPFVKSLVLLNDSDLQVQKTSASSTNAVSGLRARDERVGVEFFWKKWVSFIKTLVRRIFKI